MSQASSYAVSSSLQVHAWMGRRANCATSFSRELEAAPAGMPHPDPLHSLVPTPDETEMALAYPGARFWRPLDDEAWNGVWHITPPTPRRARELVPVSEVGACAALSS